MIHIGCIHGRFQPFHNGHYEYMLAALAVCDRLIIGITQYELGLNDTGSPAHRMKDTENPFSFWQRVEIIRSVLKYSGIDQERCEIVPFPIHNPPQIKNFVPMGCPMFTTVYEPWNQEKIGRLREHGYDVRILWEREFKAFEGKKVREALRNDDACVLSMLPPGAYLAMQRMPEIYNLTQKTC